MAQLHKGKHFPFAFRRDLWNGFQWAYRWPETLRVSFVNFVGTYGVAMNATPHVDVPILDDDPTLMEINYEGRVTIGAIAHIFFGWRVYIDTDKQPSISMSMLWPDGTHITNWNHFRPGFQTTTLNMSALIVASGGNFVSNDFTKVSTIGGSLTLFNFTGQPW